MRLKLQLFWALCSFVSLVSKTSLCQLTLLEVILDLIQNEYNFGRENSNKTTKESKENSVANLVAK